MDDQQVFNIVMSISIGLIGAMGGWLMRIMWQSLRDLKEGDSKLADKVGKIEVLVAGQYAKREDVDRMSSALFSKLDRIEDKLDGKADK